jgi:hypothetical protein
VHAVDRGRLRPFQPVSSLDIVSEAEGTVQMEEAVRECSPVGSLAWPLPKSGLVEHDLIYAALTRQIDRVSPVRVHFVASSIG